MKRILIMICSMMLGMLAINTAGLAQNEANTWYFGNFAGIDFNSGAAVSLTDGVMNATEGCASISDINTGSILMYTNGAKVWNADHQLMANGTGLTGASSSAQAAVIVPDPGNSDQYYIFTAGEYFSGGSDGYRYSIVDMSQNGGLGAVTAVKNILLYAPACEKLAVIKNSAGTGYWIATHEWNGANFVCYELTETGISSPVYSAAGTAYSNYNRIGCMKFSPDGSRLATVLSGLDQAEVYNFDASTGTVSDAMNLGTITNSFPYVYGIAFSPNGKRLYVDEENNSNLFQFDLDAGSLAEIIASKTIVGTSSSSAMQTMQLGPDKRLYICRNGSSSLAVVNDPDVAGTGCNFVDYGFYLVQATCVYGLPAFIENVFGTEPVQQVFVAASDTDICEKFCINFYDQSLNSPTAWYWEFQGASPPTSSQQNPDNICYDTPGSYDVLLVTTNTDGEDTLLLSDYITVYATPPFPIITQDGSLLTCSPAAAYQWQFNGTDIPGATGQTYTVTQSGYYTVIVFEEHGCKNSATVIVTLTGSEDVMADGGIHIYPNPSAGIFHVQTDNLLTFSYTIEVVNALGQVVFRREADSSMQSTAIIDLSDQPASVYMLRLSAGMQYLTRKLQLVK